MLITGIDNADILAVDPGRLPPGRFTPAAANEPLIVNWIMSPPSPGSGGHTTIFRWFDIFKLRVTRAVSISMTFTGEISNTTGLSCKALTPMPIRRWRTSEMV